MIEIKKACTVALMKAKNFFFLVGRCREKKKKTKGGENMLFKAYFCQIDFIKSKLYVTKSRLDVEFVKKITLEMAIGQQIKKE